MIWIIKIYYISLYQSYYIISQMKTIDVYPAKVVLDPAEVPADLWYDILDQLGLTDQDTGVLELDVHQVKCE